MALALRSKIRLECAAGHLNANVANDSGSRGTVRKWRSRFAAHRLEGLSDEPRPGAPRKITDEPVELVITKALEERGPGQDTHWSARSMAAATGMSRSAVPRIWRAFGLKPHLVRTWKLSTDPQFIRKARDVAGLCLDAPEEVLILAVDEKSQFQALGSTAPRLPVLVTTPVWLTHTYARHGPASLLAPLDVGGGSVIAPERAGTRRRHGEAHMIYRSVQDIVLDDIFLNLPGFIPGVDVFLKIEGLNPAGSIKIKTAVSLIDSLESAGFIKPGTRIIESSSGNLGIALAMVCTQRGYPLTIVTDPNVSSQAEKVMRAFGAEIVKVTERDPGGGYLQTRIGYIRDQMSRNPDLLWTNQYANAANVAAHRERTAEQLHKGIGSPDVLIAAVGTAGTLMGCLEYFSFHDLQIRIIAVDSEGSVTFGGTPALRRIPGVGASRRSEIFQDNGTFEKVVVTECDTVRTCRRIAQAYGLLAGGSTGTALAAAHQIKESFAPGDRVVVISPDLGGNYTDTVYSDSWVAEHFPEVIHEEAG